MKSMSHKQILHAIEQPKYLANTVAKVCKLQIASVALEEYETDAGIEFTNEVHIQLSSYMPKPFIVSYYKDGCFYEVGAANNVQDLVALVNKASEEVK